MSDAALLKPEAKLCAVHDRWNTDNQEGEVTILRSLIADIKAIAEERP